MEKAVYINTAAYTSGFTLFFLFAFCSQRLADAFVTIVAFFFLVIFLRPLWSALGKSTNGSGRLIIPLIMNTVAYAFLLVVATNYDLQLSSFAVYAFLGMIPLQAQSFRYPNEMKKFLSPGIYLLLALALAIVSAIRELASAGTLLSYPMTEQNIWPFVGKISAGPLLLWIIAVLLFGLFRKVSSMPICLARQEDAAEQVLLSPWLNPLSTAKLIGLSVTIGLAVMINLLATDVMRPFQNAFEDEIQIDMTGAFTVLPAAGIVLFLALLPAVQKIKGAEIYSAYLGFCLATSRVIFTMLSNRADTNDYVMMAIPALFLAAATLVVLLISRVLDSRLLIARRPLAMDGLVILTLIYSLFFLVLAKGLEPLVRMFLAIL